MTKERKQQLDQLIDNLGSTVTNGGDTKQAVLIVGISIIGALRLVCDELVEAIKERP